MKPQHYILVIMIGMICCGIPGTYAVETGNPVAMILKSGDDPFWNQVRAGTEDASLKLNVSVGILTPGIPDHSGEMTVLAFDALNESPSVLVFAPSDSSAFNPVLVAADEDGIPVFLLESPLPDEMVTGYVGSDNEAIGVRAADDLASMLNEEGSVVIISQNPKNPASLLRTESFTKQMDTKYPGMDLAVFSQDTDVDLALSIESLFADYPEIRGVFSTDGDSTRALGEVLKERDLNSSVAAVGVNGGDEAKEFVINGILQEVIAEDPYAMGYTAVETVHAFIQGEDVNPDTIINVTVFTSDVPFPASDSSSATTTPKVTPTPAPTAEGTDSAPSTYEQRLQAAAEGYDFESMTQQTAQSHYSSSSRAASMLSSGGSSSGRSGHWCPTCGGHLVWVP